MVGERVERIRTLILQIQRSSMMMMMTPMMMMTTWEDSEPEELNVSSHKGYSLSSMLKYSVVIKHCKYYI
jgi:hypothetical protein